ncbi:MAG: hypothetical protein GC164_03145 [Phycisphaera sp.]|nr:hypothetical protein [Phycisphaera sp.]
MAFTGTYEHTIDAKNRLAIPADMRAHIQATRKRRSDKPICMYVLPTEGNCLSLYTDEDFELRSEQLDHSDLDSEELLEYERVLYSLAVRVELDSQGRVRLPDHLLKMAGLSSEVVLLGVKDHLEVRDRETWRAYITNLLTARPGLLMNPRKAMKKPLGSSAGNSTEKSEP